MRNVALLGTGHALPSQVVESAALDTQLGLPPGSVFQAGGVIRRYFATPEESAASLAAQAAKLALDAACLTLDDIDCLVAASGTMDQGMPYNAALIHAELGLSGRAIPAFDINASCLGFLTAFDTLSWLVAAQRYQRILIVAADLASCGLNWNTLESSAIFGDGAAAAIIGPRVIPPDNESGAGGRILASALRTLSDGASLCQIPAGGSRFHPSRLAAGQAFAPLTLFQMDGKGVFRLAAAHLPGFVADLMLHAGLTIDEIDWVIPHQASHLALSHLSKRLGFPADKVVNIFPLHGNQIAASLPTALDIAIRDGRVRRGQRLLLLGTGAGLSLGGMVLEY
jgi:3-oxoacyl-[acyl-carrier-protein] synthase-3